MQLETSESPKTFFAPMIVDVENFFRSVILLYHGSNNIFLLFLENGFSLPPESTADLEGRLQSNIKCQRKLV